MHISRALGRAIVVGAIAGLVAFVHTRSAADAQSRPAGGAARRSDGKPDLTGFWQAVNAAHYDLEGHAAKAGPLPALGAIGGVPADLGVVEGGAIPYQPWALAKKKENEQNWLALDPLVKCY